ncbi:hypothetical protein [Pseudaminobacter salicylatoxidans]|uniref:hypothetical protein n=1 Tax=Pseudaminobacter salicylatoxidans TaxID=93369 RepID=UPI0012F6678E|nr:hypothetical protein [Pseudaminobacter salicylatoxidans]
MRNDIQTADRQIHLEPKSLGVFGQSFTVFPVIRFKDQALLFIVSLKERVEQAFTKPGGEFRFGLNEPMQGECQQQGACDHSPDRHTRYRPLFRRDAH